jgi:uncharacterized protein (TIGR03000 family)
VKPKSWFPIACAALIALTSPTAAWGQVLRRSAIRVNPIIRPAPFERGRLPDPVRYHYIDTSWQNSPYTYYLIHHEWPIPSYPYPYPYPDPYPFPYPPFGGDGYTAIPDYYGGTPDSGNPYSDRPTTAVLPQNAGNNAVIHVRAPVALADILFDDYKTSSTGLNRVLTTPDLTPGKTYTYSVTANWSEGGLPRSETRTVQVQAGQSVTVDFTKKA